MEIIQNTPETPSNVTTSNSSNNTSPIAGKKVVIVEDDQFIAGLISSKIIKEGAIVVHIGKGSEASKSIIENKPDIVLLDLLLPEVDGFEILKSVRNTDGFKDIPIIIFSNMGDALDVKKAKDLGATDFLIKASVNLNQVPSLIAKYLTK